MGEITLLLHQWRDGDRAAEEQLFGMVMPNLRRLAHHLMKGERQDHTFGLDGSARCEHGILQGKPIHQFPAETLTAHLSTEPALPLSSGFNP